MCALNIVQACETAHGGWGMQIRTMEAGAVAAVARVMFESEAQGWPEALQWMTQAAGSPNKSHREVALVLLAALMERIGALVALLYVVALPRADCSGGGRTVSV